MKQTIRAEIDDIRESAADMRRWARDGMAKHGLLGAAAIVAAYVAIGVALCAVFSYVSLFGYIRPHDEAVELFWRMIVGNVVMWPICVFWLSRKLAKPRS